MPLRLTYGLHLDVHKYSAVSESVEINRYTSCEAQPHFCIVALPYKLQCSSDYAKRQPRLTGAGAMTDFI